MRGLIGTVLLAALAAALLPVGAHAAEQTLTFRSGPITIKPYFTAQGQMRAESPQVDGYVTGINVELVDAAGKILGDDDVMLHHVVLANVLHPDTVCTSYTSYSGQRIPYAPERFFALGEERFALSLPAGYGYENKATDVWGLVYMLMNHHTTTETAYVRYTVRYVTGEELTPAKPIWLDIRNCQADPVWDVPGTGGKSSTYSQSSDFRLPLSGRLIGAGGHLHGGRVSLELSNPTCGQSLFASLPSYGRVEPRPLLHEGGPSKMSAFQTPLGIPVSAGDTLRLTATYDNSLPHTRVMGIMIAYLAPGVIGPCAPPPALTIDLGSPSRPPLAKMPLATMPKGPLKHVTNTWVGDYRFGAGRVSIPRGTRFTWDFVGTEPHNVTLANGPVGFSSPNVLHGSWSYRFTKPGTYQLYCALHPVAMTQVVVVR